MDRMLYIAADGASQIQQAQAVNANNLANASTSGFKAQFDLLRSLPVYGPGFASRVHSQAEIAGVDQSAGALMATGRNLDIAVNSNGWIAVQAADGSEAYTRAGDLHVSASGILETGTGLAVLGDGGQISIPEAQALEIGTDGTVSVLPIGQSAATLAVVGRIKLVNIEPGNLVKGEDGLLRQRNGGVAAADASVRIASGVLESSNVNAVEAMTTMIQLARQFEAQVKLMKVAEENDAAAAKLMSVG